MTATAIPLDGEPVAGGAVGVGGWLVDAADLLAEPDPGPTPWLVDRLIVDQALVAAVGRWKTTKSYGLLEICVAVATGRPAFGALAVPDPGPVVYVNEESGRVALQRRLDSLCRGRAIPFDTLRGRLFLGANSRIKLDDREWQERLVELGQNLEPRLIVFDPLARMKASARDENAQTDMAPVIEYLRHLRDETGAAVCFVHHTGHQGDRMRGSSDLESAWETRLTWKRDGQSHEVEVESEHREAEAGPVLRYRINYDGDTRTMRLDAQTEAGIPPLADRIVEHVTEQPAKARDIAKTLQVRASDVDRTLAALVADGTLVKGPSGRADKLGRPLRDEVYTLAGGSSQTLFPDTPGTSHGTSHRPPGRTRTSHAPDTPQTPATTGIVARPEHGTSQDEPGFGHRGSVLRPPLYKGDERDEPPDEAPDALDGEPG